jgi:hypothetical protein
MGYLYEACDQISDYLIGFYTHWTYMHIFRHIFLSNYWWLKSDIWSQASYRYPISWEAFLDPSDSYFLFADFVDFYTHWTYKTNCSWPLTLIMQKHDHFRLLRHHYSESPVIPLSNDIWYRCVAHGFITFYKCIFLKNEIQFDKFDGIFLMDHILN